MTRAGPTARLATSAVLVLATLLLAGCGDGSAYGDPWTNQAQQERLGSEGERDPEMAKALRERARYKLADR